LDTAAPVKVGFLRASGISPYSYRKYRDNMLYAFWPQIVDPIKPDPLGQILEVASRAVLALWLAKDFDRNGRAKIKLLVIPGIMDL
jgi:hypothetical protein